MKNFIQQQSTKLLFYILALVSFGMPGCKKTKTGFETKVSFTYNGQQYSISNTDAVNTQLLFPELIFANFAGLEIKRADLFGGTIHISSNTNGGIHCAFLNPTGMNVGGIYCSSLTNNGGPIDSVAVYWLESGNLSVAYTQCKVAEGTSVPGQFDCLVSGNFSVTLVNKNNQRIALTNGSFYGPMRKYP